MKEIWKNVIGYEGLYEVSNYGNVRSLEKEVVVKGFQKNIKGIRKQRTLSQKEDKQGYLFVRISKNGIRKRIAVHRLVAYAFLKQIDGKTQVNHIDGNVKNNHSDNLEWVNNYENSYHRDFVLRNKSRYLCVETGRVFNSLTDVEREMKIKGSNVCSCINGRIETAYGYHWERV